MKGHFKWKVITVKLNQRIYEYADEENLIERQELDGHNLEIYRLNPYEDIYTEFTNKGKFAVWSSVDGQNYRLYIEDGYYKKLSPLYTNKINDIWLKFWDDCEKVTTKFRNLVIPLAFVVVIAAFIVNMLPIGGKYTSLGITCGLAVLYMIFLFMYKKVVNKKLALLNHESVDKIKKHMGAKRFEKLLEDQRAYMDEFFQYDEPADENADEAQVALEEKEIQEIEALDIEIPQENKEAELEEVEVVAEADSEEVKE